MASTCDVKACIWAAVLLSATFAQAVTVINKTTGQVLLFDDFEKAGNGISLSAYPDVSGDYDPTARIGSWSVNETGPTNVQVTSYLGNSPDPAAIPQGTNYLRVVRHMAAVAQVDFSMPVPQSTTGDVIHTEAMVWIPSGVNANAFQIQLIGSGGVTDYRVNVTTAAPSGNGGNVNVWDATLTIPTFVDTTLDWLVNTWQKWEFDYAVGNTNFDLTIDGVKKTLPRSGVAGDIKIVSFRCGAQAANMQFRLDSTGYDGKKQDSFTLFRDGFENSVTGAVPVIKDPDIGTYLGVGNGALVRSGSLLASNGPPGAFRGSNYLEVTRLGGLNANIGCMFAGGAIKPNAQELHASFRLWWNTAGFVSFALSDSLSITPTNSLVFNGIRNTRTVEALTGAVYQVLAPAGTFPTNMWTLIELVWYPKTQVCTLSLNGGTPLRNSLYGPVPNVLNRLWLQTGAGTTVYWVDDVEAHWLYTPPHPGGTLISVK